jgi:wyosine [tRNA(Phe)-imidazoG37] synthetase (radical SAM superfamily)
MFVYGPVPSRRLGRSLGVSPIPSKTCSYSCVYCQLGRTTSLEAKRKSYFPKEKILEEILQKVSTSASDFITFVGDGEPTLNADLGWLIRQTKREIELPVAVITNGSLFFMKDVRKDLLLADVVLPTLDAGDQEKFKRINRPHKSIDFDTMLQGQIDFRREFSGNIWLEVMLVKGLNDSTEQLEKIKRAVDKINPDRIYISVPIRPPAEKWAEIPSPESILRAQEILQGSTSLDMLESGEFGIEEFSDTKQAILEIGSRHPLRKSQAYEIEKRLSETGIVDSMISDRELFEMEYNNETYLMPSHLNHNHSRIWHIVPPATSR